jgi:Flp pilus assembly pilin Flp
MLGAIRAFVSRCTGNTRLREDEGQTLVEYSAILTLVAVVAVVILGVLGAYPIGVFEEVAAAL